MENTGSVILREEGCCVQVGSSANLTTIIGLHASEVNSQSESDSKALNQ